MPRNVTIFFQVDADDDGVRHVAKVSVVSYGVFPMGTRPIPFEADSRDAAIEGLKRYVRRTVSADRIRFTEG